MQVERVLAASGTQLGSTVAQGGHEPLLMGRQPNQFRVDWSKAERTCVEEWGSPADGGLDPRELDDELTGRPLGG